MKKLNCTSSLALVPFVAAALVLGLAGGCLSMQNQATLDGGPATPYVEAFVAYPGPQDKWAGPAAFVLHVVARESGMAVITVSSAFRNQTTETTSSTRAPSSATTPEAASRAENLAHTDTGSQSESGVQARGMTADAARELLGHLAESVAGPLAPFQGCLSPVRVRLVREDGALVEKLGCRSEKGWARATSEIVSQFITARVEGTAPAAVPTAPLATPTADNKDVTEVVKASEKEVMRGSASAAQVASEHEESLAKQDSHGTSDHAEEISDHGDGLPANAATAAATHAEHEKTGRAPASAEASLAASAEAAVRAAEAAAVKQPSDSEHTLPSPPSGHSDSTADGHP